MTIPIWVLATILYVIALAWSGKTEPSGGRGDIFAGLSVAFSWMGWTIAYLLFWIIYLAL